jgi:hypothetical protein
MPWHVFKEAPLRLHLFDDAGDVWPEVPGVVFPLAGAAECEGLAGITGRDEMNAATPRFAIEGFEIVPNRSRIQGRVRHPRHESGCGETVSFDITHSSVSGFCEVKAKIKSCDTGAKAEAANVFMFFGGTKSHTLRPFHHAPGVLVKGSRASVLCETGTGGT